MVADLGRQKMRSLGAGDNESISHAGASSLKRNYIRTADPA